MVKVTKEQKQFESPKAVFENFHFLTEKATQLQKIFEKDIKQIDSNTEQDIRLLFYNQYRYFMNTGSFVLVKLSDANYKDNELRMLQHALNNIVYDSFINLFSLMETHLRYLVRFLTEEENISLSYKNNKGNDVYVTYKDGFYKTQEALLKSYLGMDTTDKLEFLKIAPEIRNTIHNLFIYNPMDGKDKKISFRNYEYSFEVDKPVKLGFFTFYNLYDAILCTMDDIYFHQKIKKYNYIPCKAELIDQDFYLGKVAITIYDQKTGAKLL